MSMTTRRCAMALPLMQSDPMVLTPRSASPALTVHSTVHEARERLCATGDTAAVLVRDGRPVAVVTRRAVEQAVAAGRADAPVGSAADFVAVPVDRTADALATVHVFTRAAWDWLRDDRDRGCSTRSA
jgi:CBS domain-containing protein